MQVQQTTQTKPKDPLLRDFPDALTIALENELLPPDDVALHEDRLETAKNIRFAEHGMAILKKYVAEHKENPKVVVQPDGTLKWTGSPKIEIAKGLINRHPRTAYQAYVTFDQGWTMDEIVDVVKNDASTAYYLAIKDPEAPIMELQEAANKDPQWAYFFAKRFEMANTNSAIEATKKSPYYHYLALAKLKKEPDEAREYINRLAPFNAEAAYTWARITLTQRAEIPNVIFKRLALDKKWSYLAVAWKAVADPRENNPDYNPATAINDQWAEIRNLCLLDPQWAYHWAIQIEPEILSMQSVLELIACHPGWTAQLIEDVPSTTPMEIEQRDRLIEKLPKLCNEQICGATPNPNSIAYYQALVCFTFKKQSEQEDPENSAKSQYPDDWPDIETFQD